MRTGDDVQDAVEVLASVAVPLFAAVTALLWLGDRPGGPLRWRLASVSAAAAAGIGLLANQAIGRLWFRERPFAAHPADTVLLAPPSPDPSFPSDHATAAFAIAFAVFFVSRRAGVLFLAGALAIGLLRVFLGLHYPGDVSAGALIGLGAAWVALHPARRPLTSLTALLSRAADPLVRPFWRLLGGPARRNTDPP